MDITQHIDKLHRLKPLGEGDAASMLAGVSLPAFLRALLVADGTVTVLLRAYFDEPIEVTTIDQSSFSLTAALAALRLGRGEDAFQRQVSLTGVLSRTGYATATSIINPGVLPTALFQALIQENVGMGEVLRNSARGSYREVLDIQFDGDRVERTYLVTLEGKPAILITERFNVAAFQQG